MKLPELPHSPYLYTEWKDATTPARVSSTMFKEEQLQTYGRQCAEAMREACAAKCGEVQADWIEVGDHVSAYTTEYLIDTIRALEIEE